jgi:hypothetical protein
MPDEGEKKLDLESPEVKAAISAAVNAAIEPLKKKNDELINEKKTLSDKLNGFNDEEIERFRDFQKKMENDEDAKLISEGKIQEVIDKRTERMRESYQQQISETSKTADEWKQKYEGATTSLHNTLIDAEVRKAAIEGGVAPTALDDIIVRARREFTYENDRVVSKDPNTGDVKIGSDGKTPYNPKEFIKELKTSAPHFWPASTGGGLTGGFGSSEEADVARKSALHSGGMEAFIAAKRKDRDK